MLLEAFGAEAIDRVADAELAEALLRARCAHGSRRAAREARHDRSSSTPTRLRRRGDPRGFSDPGRAALRQAARLSRQRRLGAEAARGHRAARRTPTSTNTPTFIAACIISPMPRPKPTRRRARACAASSTPPRSRRSSSRARRPRRSISSPRASGSRTSARATRSCCRSWSTTPISCRGISTASARARC